MFHDKKSPNTTLIILYPATRTKAMSKLKSPTNNTNLQLITNVECSTILRNEGIGTFNSGLKAFYLRKTLPRSSYSGT